jgi:hypothetical protein
MPDKTISAARSQLLLPQNTAWCRLVPDPSGSSRARKCREMPRGPGAVSSFVAVAGSMSG